MTNLLKGSANGIEFGADGSSLHFSSERRREAGTTSARRFRSLSRHLDTNSDLLAALFGSVCFPKSQNQISFYSVRIRHGREPTCSSPSPVCFCFPRAIRDVHWRRKKMMGCPVHHPIYPFHHRLQHHHHRRQHCPFASCVFLCLVHQATIANKVAVDDTNTWSTRNPRYVGALLPLSVVCSTVSSIRTFFQVIR